MPQRSRTRATVAGRPARPDPGRQVGLRPLSDLPGRAKLFLVAAGLVIVGFAAWVTVRLLNADSEILAILLIALSYLGAAVIGLAVVTLTRMAFSLRSMPYVLGRAVRRLLTPR